ncbi:PAS/PAC sensor hybrid histidine kinase [Desulfatibacillum aliphaticivorans]|uniref:histidine kinase n=1 Tax=Desulfatibacillum aliphaticivorans TaxID=218208 RepID=B8FDZ8_DESAL|nr:PAS/PAC sensor hybrid histidine kinase [Desulfatibacillum aliphaticivorans]
MFSSQSQPEMNNDSRITPKDILDKFSLLEKRILRSQEDLEQLSAFIEELPIGILDFDLETNRVVGVNRALRDLSGYEVHEAASMEPKDFLAPESMDLMKNRVARSLSGEHISEHSEYAFFTKSGKKLWCQLAQRLILKNGKPWRILAVVQDITYRKRLEKARQEGEEKFRNILENTQDCFYQTDIHGNVIWTSPATAKLLDYALDEVMGKNVARTFYARPEDRERLLETMRSSGKVSDYEVLLQRKDGTTVWVSTNSQYYTDENGVIQGVEGVFRDISAQRRAEKQLREAHAQLEQRVAERTRDLEEINRDLKEEIARRRTSEKALNHSENKYRTILENIEDGYYEVDLKGNFTFFNAAMAKILDCTPDELQDLNYRKLADKETVGKVFKVFSKVFKTGKPFKSADYQLVKKDGTRSLLNISVSLIRDMDGGNMGFRGVVRDITERNAAEEEKRDLELKLLQAQKMEAMGTLAGGVAHDFNNLLMGLQGNVSLILLELGKDHPTYERLKKLEGFIKDATGLTRQLLGFARGGKYEVTTTDINQLINKTLEIFGRTRKGIRISRALGDVWPVDVDQGQIEQVLLNLYVNAGQAMPKGGNLKVSTRNVHLDEIFVAPHGLKKGRFVKTSVTDTGIGMDLATQQKVFDPFFTTKDIGRGTGLGLSSAYGIMKNHGGVINVFSKPGKGSTFNIYLPASESSVQEASPEAEGVEYGVGTVLLVDDEEVVLRAGQEILKILGYTALIANRGRKAIEIVKAMQGKIDLVILDLIMPDLHGGEVFDVIREINPKIKVLLSSGYSLDGQAAEIMARGCEAFIQKPFTVEALSQKIKAVLGA